MSFCVLEIAHDRPRTVQVTESFEEACGAALALSADDHLTSVADTSGVPEVKLWFFRDGRELTDAEAEALRRR
jgi:hypothetical protein